MGKIHGFIINKHALMVNSILFVDNTILFSQASTREAQCLNSMLDYCIRAIGQRINRSK